MKSAISGLEEPSGSPMYVFQHTVQLSIEESHSPFGGKLNLNNRWVLIQKVIPWMSLERPPRAPVHRQDRSPSQVLPDGVRGGVHPVTIGSDGSRDGGADHGITVSAIFHWPEWLPATAAV